MFDLLKIALWLIAAYVTLSCVEYAAHRWIQHNRLFGREHHQHGFLHHGVYYGTRFENAPDPAAAYISVDLSPWAFVPMLAFLWGPVMYADRRGGVIFLLTFTAWCVVWTTIHREMHEPRGRWFARTRLYQILHAYHRAHHRHNNRNFNVVCLGADHIFGTVATEDTCAP